MFEKASRLIEKHQERAEKIADEIEPEELRALLYYLIDSVLDHARSSTSALTGSTKTHESAGIELSREADCLVP